MFPSMPISVVSHVSLEESFESFLLEICHGDTDLQMQGKKLRTSGNFEDFGG